MDVRELDLSDVAAWPRWLKVVAHLATVAWVFGGGYWMALGEQRRELAALGLTGDELRSTIESKTRTADGMPALERRRRELEATLAAALRPFPTAVDLPTLIEDMSTAALDSGLAIDSIHVSDEQTLGFYNATPVALVVAGGYHQFGAFVAATGGLDRLVTIHDFEIETQGGRLTLTLAARAYRRLDDPGADADFADEGDFAPAHVGVAYVGAGRSPFDADRASAQAAPPAEVQAEQPLESFALARLSMVGVLARRGIAHAVVRDPTGHLHRVATGDRLGLQGGRVTRVAFDRLEVTETVSDETQGWARRLRRIELGPAAEHANEEPEDETQTEEEQ